MRRRRRRVITEEDLRQRLRKNVLRLRHAADLTAEEAADRGGLSLRVWQRIEAASTNFRLATLAKLGRALEVDPAELIADHT